MKTAREHPISSGMFNLREVIKQALLLEGHLFTPAKECQDCILKHILTIEALAEEGLALPGGPLLHRTLQCVSTEAAKWLTRIQNKEPLYEVGQSVRAIRKRILEVIGDDI